MNNFKSKKGVEMKLDIKSFLIGILTTVNLFLLMGFDDHEDESQKNGRYQVISIMKDKKIGMILAMEIKLQWNWEVMVTSYLKKKVVRKQHLRKNLNYLKP